MDDWSLVSAISYCNEYILYNLYETPKASNKQLLCYKIRGEITSNLYYGANYYANTVLFIVIPRHDISDVTDNYFKYDIN